MAARPDAPEPTERTDVASVYDTEEAITREVLERFAATPNPRLREIMLSLIRHLHGFARDVRLTEQEWLQAMDFLAETAQWVKPGRNEFIILSDATGLSMLTVTMANPKPAHATSATVLGPFMVPDAPEFPNGADIAGEAAGEPFFVRGRVLDTDGGPIAGAVLDVWHSDERGLYDVQGDLARTGYWARGRLRSDADGSYRFRSVVPVDYPTPPDGTAAKLFKATTGRSWRPAHLHYRISAAGFDTLTTHVFRRGSPHLDSDAVFGVRPALVAEYLRHEAGTAPDGTRIDVPFYTLDFDVVMTRSAR